MYSELTPRRAHENKKPTPPVAGDVNYRVLSATTQVKPHLPNSRASNPLAPGSSQIAASAALRPRLKNMRTHPPQHSRRLSATTLKSPFPRCAKRHDTIRSADRRQTIIASTSIALLGAFNSLLFFFLELPRQPAKPRSPNVFIFTDFLSKASCFAQRPLEKIAIAIAPHTAPAKTDPRSATGVADKSETTTLTAKPIVSAGSYKLRTAQRPEIHQVGRRRMCGINPSGLSTPTAYFSRRRKIYLEQHQALETRQAKPRLKVNALAMNCSRYPRH